MEVDQISKRTCEQMLLNTCMTVDLPNNRLLKPVVASDKKFLFSIIGSIDSGLPLNYFWSGLPTPFPIPSHHRLFVPELYNRMQTLALRRGLGNGPHDYHLVPVDLCPPCWHKGAARDAIVLDVNNKTHDEWIEEKFGEYPGVTRSGVRRTGTLRDGRLSGYQPQAQPQPQPPPSLSPVNQPQPAIAMAALLAQRAPHAPMPAIDPRFEGPVVAAFGSTPISPVHFTNAEGSFSCYVEAAHRREYEEAAVSPSHTDGSDDEPH
ncbi:uncharacterized protein Z519_00114 [Cladophialophora bantiana CBS 173.52]|uniref:Uncharacterized protein n=1 Tax=Cladophialophora bantiana (strain ATCC 10958 / CBS 173.52 / CDC B-1940 / NIH 8579) TaxID=1442370 RepID=A0A0D2HYG1_CLAB1|nr:uncharacterized protein Z519_00114 [Cladophialophora bantiana CBS 173.52]KIW98453.1 hypothetical protein Z519_00114 [Cladophialophora bantiana CBS 173.52]